MIICLVFASASFAQEKHPLIGTWRFVSSTVTRKGAAQTTDASKINSVCIYTPTDYLFIAKNKSDNSFAYAGMGKVALGNGTFTEKITHSSIKKYCGSKLAIYLRDKRV